MKKKAENLEIQPLNDDVLANLSIEDLEERLELQLLHVTEAQGCWDCGVECGTSILLLLLLLAAAVIPVAAVTPVVAAVIPAAAAVVAVAAAATTRNFQT